MGLMGELANQSHRRILQTLIYKTSFYNQIWDEACKKLLDVEINSWLFSEGDGIPLEPKDSKFEPHPNRQSFFDNDFREEQGGSDPANIEPPRPPSYYPPIQEDDELEKFPISKNDKQLPQPVSTHGAVPPSRSAQRARTFPGVGRPTGAAIVQNTFGDVKHPLESRGDTLMREGYRHRGLTLAWNLKKQSRFFPKKALKA
ncbi:hypothetical protein QFC24_005127 [Naganishia onofrii]|uniref:Uncharacterized protein n=1 Tax=Naganishia onofrii TaxID=1851511 RepID=A0ACC2XA38_9TREE|nr:hypothetical protein QFC24_005127 [Naganishia onofrii]